MEQIPDILGQSQTFLGVLITLNVLCLFGDKTGNFILRTILNQKDRMKRQINNLYSLLSQETSEIEKSEAWEKVEKIADLKSGFEGEEQLKARELMMAYNFEDSKFVIDITSFDKNSESIENSNEQFIGPLLSLYYGLTIFVLNEIAVYIGGVNTLFVNTIYVFTIVAFAYSFSLWCSFAIRKYPILNKSYGFHKKLWNDLDSISGIYHIGMDKIVLCAGVFALIVLYVNFTNLPDWLSLIISTLAFLIIITALGLSRLHVSEVKGNYSYFHALGHMTAFIVYALIIAYIIDRTNLAQVYENILTLPAIRLTIIAFVIVNGILLPLIIPYLKIDLEAGKMRNEITTVFKGRQIAADKFHRGYDELCKRQGEKAITRKIQNISN